MRIERSRGFPGRVRNTSLFGYNSGGAGGQVSDPAWPIYGTSEFYAPRTSSITQSRGSGTPTETRATTATVMGYAPAAVLADGQTLLTVASGELRFKGARRVSEGVWSTVDADGVPIPSATLDGSLVEAAATNLCLQSQDWATTWTVQANVALAANNTTAPDGTATADKLTSSTTGTADVVIFQGVTLVTSSTYTLSLYVKAGSQGSKFTIYLRDATSGDTGGAAFNPNTGAYIDNGGSTGLTIVGYGSESVVGGWYRYYVAVTTELNAGCQFSIRLNDLSGQVSGDNLYVWGAQLELGSYATEYIPTTTAAVTRNKDVLDDQVSGNLTAAAGTVAFQWTPTHNPSGTVALGGSYVDASNYTVLLHDATKYIFRKRIAGTNYDAELTAAFVSGTTYSVAAYWGASGSNIAVDGVAGTANTTGIEGVQYGKLTGVAGMYFSTPDSAANSLVTNFTGIALFSATDVTPGANKPLCGKRNVANSYQHVFDTAGKLHLYWWDSTVLKELVSSVAIPSVADNTPIWVKYEVTFDAGTATGTFYSAAYVEGSNEIPTFTQFGTQPTVSSVGIDDSTSLLEVGSDGSGGIWAGDIYRLLLYKNGTLAVDFNPADYTHGTTWTSSTTGEVYTMNGNAAVWPAVKLGTRWQWGADGNGGQQAGAAFKEKYMWTRALSNQELGDVA